MINNHTITQIQDIIKGSSWVSPFLFLWSNPESANQQIIAIAKNILEQNNIPLTAFFYFDIPDKNIKIKDIKSFIEPSFSQASHGLQIFFIPDISRFTISSGNSLLKFLEEPSAGNIIFLSNTSESWVLDTILSRCQNISLGRSKQNTADPFFQDIIHHHIHKNNHDLISYFFQKKCEKEEYISFLQNLIFYSKKHLVYTQKLSQIQSDIEAIVNNNALPKYIVDTWILEL